MLCPFTFCMLHILQPIYLQDNGSYNVETTPNFLHSWSTHYPMFCQLLPHIRNCRKLPITAPKIAATALACSPTSQLPTASTHAASVTASHALDRPLSKLLSAPVADFLDVAKLLTHTAAESANAHARCHCRCMLSFLPVVFTLSLGLPIVQTYR